MTPIYLDHSATTPVRPEVLNTMLPYLDSRFGNPSSIHRWGREARAAMEEARERVAAALGAKRQEIVFTSGGTEADNLAVLGRVRKAMEETGRAGVAVSAIEHKAVHAAAQQAQREGAELIVLGVDTRGVLDLGALDEALRARPSLVSVMWGNNEIGSLQPVRDIAQRCAAAGVDFHTDAVQAIGRDRVRVDEAGCALLTLSGHKIGAPKGSGALFIRSGVQLAPILHGGGQERGVRPGTESVAHAVALATALELAMREQEAESQRLRALRDQLQAAIVSSVPDAIVNGVAAARLPHVLNVSFPGIDQEALLVSLDMEGIAASSGSACQSGSVEVSHVLVAIGRPGAEESSVRFSLGRTTTAAEIDAVAERVPAIVSRLQEFATR